MYRPAIKSFEAWFAVAFLVFASVLLWHRGGEVAEGIKGAGYVASSMIFGRTWYKRKVHNVGT